MVRIMTAALGGFCVALGCASSPAPTSNNSGGTIPVPFVPAPTTSTSTTTTPPPVATGVVDAGGMRRPTRAPSPPAGTVLTDRRGPSGPGSGRTAWPWEDRGLSPWERWFAVHGTAWLFPASPAPSDSDAPTGRVGEPTAPADVALLRRVLACPAPAVARAATDALGSAGAAGTPALISALGIEGTVRRAAIAALGEVGGPDAVAALGALLRDPKTIEAERLLALTSLGAAGGNDATRICAAVLADGSASGAQRSAAALALGRAGGATVAPLLTARLDDADEAPRVRAAALAGLCHAAPDMAFTIALRALAAGDATRLAPREVRHTAALSCYVLARPEAVPLLARLVAGRALPARHSGKALARVCEELPDAVAARVHEALAKAVAERGALTTDEAVAVAAAAVGASAREAVTTRVRELLDAAGRVFEHLSGGKLAAREDEEVRGLAALALGRCGDRVVLPVLVEALRDSHYGVRGYAALAIGLIGDPAGRGPLLAQLRGSDPALRSAAAIGLGFLADPAVRRTLCTMAMSGDPEARAGALLGLAVARGREALGPAAHLLHHKSHPGLRAVAARVLARIPGPEATTLLHAEFDASDAVVRREAARAAGWRGDTAATRYATALRAPNIDPRVAEALCGALAAAGRRSRGEPVALALAGLPADVAPELAAALLATHEPRFSPARD